MVVPSAGGPPINSSPDSSVAEFFQSIALFDVFTGGQVPSGHRSLAFALRFRAPDRTLTDAETSAARDAALAVAVQRCGAVLRSF